MRGKNLFRKSYVFRGARAWVWRIADMTGDVVSTGRATSAREAKKNAMIEERELLVRYGDSPLKMR